MSCDIDFNKFITIFNGFNQVVQIPFGFALGLAFSQTNITVGWIFFWIVAWELGVYLIFGRTKYYDPFFRVAYNCVFLLSILLGQYIYFGKTTFENFLYPNAVDEKYVGEKLAFMDKIELYLEDFINGEEQANKRHNLYNKHLYYNIT